MYIANTCVIIHDWLVKHCVKKHVTGSNVDL